MNSDSSPLLPINPSIRSHRPEPVLLPPARRPAACTSQPGTGLAEQRGNLPAVVVLILLLFPFLPCEGAVMTINQVGQAAFNAGFRGGALVSAIAAAEAESGFDPDIVGNNLHLMDDGGNLRYTNGIPVIVSVPRTGQQKMPLNSIQILPGRQQGKVIGWCRGLWQFNSVVFGDKPTDAQAFDPAAAARCAWIISRHGRDWGKWRVMRNGTAFQADRMARARAAALAIDPSVIPAVPPAGLRVEARVTGGFIRATAAGAVLRTLHRYDSGVLTGSPVQATITLGQQTSIKTWRQVQWDTGVTGWAAEDLLAVSTSTARRPASPVFDGSPDRAFHIGRSPVFRWTVGGNTVEHRLYVSTTATPGASDLKWTGFSDSWQANYNLAWGTRHWWRVDSRGYNGVWAPGPVYSFCTELPPPGYVVIQGADAQPGAAQAGWPITITGTAFCDAEQPVLIGASLVSNSGEVLNDSVHDTGAVISGTSPFSRTFDIPVTAAAGTWTVRVALWQDADKNGRIGSADRMLAQANDYIFMLPPGPKLGQPSVSPPSAPPGTTLTISVPARPIPGYFISYARLFRAEGDEPPHPDQWQEIVPQNLQMLQPGTITFTDTPPTIRRYWYAIQAMDSLNRWGPPSAPYFQSTSARITLNDHTAPVISWSYPAQDGQTLTGFTNPNGTVTDNDKIDSMTSSLDGAPPEFLFQQGGNWSVLFNNAPGTHSITIYAVDRSGNATTSTRLYYIAGAGGFPQAFDEAFDFTGDVTPSGWFTGGGTVTGGRLTATGDGDTGRIGSSQKTQPAGSHGVETGFLCGPEGGAVKWTKLFGSGPGVKVVRTSATQWQLETSENFTPRITPLSIPGGTAPAAFAVFAIFSEGRLYCRVGRAAAPYEIFGETNWSSPGLQSTDFTGCEFSIKGSNRGVSWLDSVQIRSLPGGRDAWLATRTFRRVPSSSTQWDVDWVSFAGRQYRMEYLSGGAWLQAGSLFNATGLVSSSRVTLPSGSRGIFRVRQVIP